MKTYLVYLDAVIIFYNILEDPIRSVDEIVILLTDDDVTLNINKWQLIQRQGEQLGHMFKPGWL